MQNIRNLPFQRVLGSANALPLPLCSLTCLAVSISSAQGLGTALIQAHPMPCEHLHGFGLCQLKVLGVTSTTFSCSV